MNPVEIRPLDPLVLGDGRPFGTEPGAQSAGGLDLPTPATLAGLLRTALGRAAGGTSKSGAEFWRPYTRVSIRGPLLRRSGKIHVPAPSDIVPMETADGELALVRARPGSWNPGEGADLPSGVAPVLLPPAANGLEPTKLDGPRFVTLCELASWYADRELWGAKPQCGIWKLGPETRAEWDRREVAKQTRMHVSIDPGTLASADGLLYSTVDTAYDTGDALLAQVDGSLEPQLVSLGGERRMAALSTGDPASWNCPPDVAAGLAKTCTVAMVLLTPACFSGGWVPTSLFEMLGVRGKIVGAVARRREAVSGWDLAARRPKPVRWLVPAGAVYFLELEDDAKRLGELWLTAVSDDEQARRDGFGLAAFFPTVW